MQDTAVYTIFIIFLLFVNRLVLFRLSIWCFNFNTSAVSPSGPSDFPIFSFFFIARITSSLVVSSCSSSSSSMFPSLSYQQFFFRLYYNFTIIIHKNVWLLSFLCVPASSFFLRISYICTYLFANVQISKT